MGKWIKKLGVNLNVVHCPDCHEEQPKRKTPQRLS